MTKRIKNFSSLTDREIIERISSDDYEGGNILLSPDTSWESRIKYQIGKEILAHQQENRLTLEVVAKKLIISEEELYGICRGKIDNFSSKELSGFLRKLISDYPNMLS